MGMKVTPETAKLLKAYSSWSSGWDGLKQQKSQSASSLVSSVLRANSGVGSVASGGSSSTPEASGHELGLLQRVLSVLGAPLSAVTAGYQKQFELSPNGVGSLDQIPELLGAAGKGFGANISQAFGDTSAETQADTGNVRKVSQSIADNIAAGKRTGKSLNDLQNSEVTKGEGTVPTIKTTTGEPIPEEDSWWKTLLTSSPAAQFMKAGAASEGGTNGLFLNNLLAAGVGSAEFGGSVALDPLTYVGVGIGGASTRLVRNAASRTTAKAGENIIDNAPDLAPVADTPTGPVGTPGNARPMPGPSPANIPEPQLALPAGPNFGGVRAGGEFAKENIFPVRFGQGETGQGALFGADQFRGTKVGGSPAAARSGLADRVGPIEVPGPGPLPEGVTSRLPEDLPVGGQEAGNSALFNPNPNPKVQGLVANIAAYPKMPGKRSTPVQAPEPTVAPLAAEPAQSPLAPVVEAPTPAPASPTALVTPPDLPSPRVAAAMPALQKIDRYVENSSSPMVVEAIHEGGSSMIPTTAGEVWKALRDDAKQFNGHPTAKLRIVNRDGRMSWGAASKIAQQQMNKIAGENVKATAAANVAAKEVQKVAKKEARKETSQELIARTTGKKNETPAPVVTVSGEVDSVAKVADDLATGETTAVERVAGNPEHVHSVKPISGKRAEAIDVEVSNYVEREVAKGGWTKGGSSTVRSTKIPFGYNPTMQFKFLSELIHKPLVKEIRYKKGGTINSEASDIATLDSAYSTLKHVEQVFVEKGVIPMSYGNGKVRFPIRLSTIIEAFSRDLNMTPSEVLHRMFTDEGFAKATIDKLRPKNGRTNDASIGQLAGFDNVQQAINDAKAGKVVNTAAEVKTAVPAVVEKMDAAKAELGGTPIAEAAVVDNLQSVVGGGVSDEVLDVVKADVKAENAPVTATAQVVEKNKAASMKAVETNTPDPIVGNKTAKAAAEDAGHPIKNEPFLEAETGVWAAFMNKICASHGVKLIHPVWRSNLNSIKQVLHDYTSAYDNPMANFTQEQMSAAIKQVNGTLQKGGDAAVNEAANFIRQRYSNLYSLPGFSKYAAGNTLATRSAMTMDELNAAMNRMGLKGNVFTSDMLTSQAGVITDFSKGSDWLNSGLIYLQESDNVLLTMKKMEAATAEVLSRKMVLEHIGGIWGSPVATASKVNQVNTVPELAGLHFDPAMAREINELAKKMDEVLIDPGPVLRFIDTVTRMFKSTATIYNPSHHINNLVGDSFMAYLAGAHLTPNIMNKARKAMYSQKGYYGDGLKPQVASDNLASLLGDKTASSRILTGSATGDSVISRVSVRGKSYDISGDIYTNYMRDMGLLPKYNIVEDLVGKEFKGGGRVLHPFNDRVSAQIHRVSEVREHSIRYAHFISIFEQNVGVVAKKYPKFTPQQVLDTAADAAGASVRKYHPDGLDMTGFEKDVMRRLIPFYSWMRKAMPIMVMGAVARPAKVMLPSKMNFSLQNAMGIEPESMQNPFPFDEAFPDWIGNLGIGPQQKYDGGSAFGASPDGGLLLSAMGGLPFTGLGGQYLNDPIRGIGSAINPLARVPAEIFTNSQVQTEQPIQGAGGTGMLSYLSKQVPAVATPSRLTGVGQKEGQNNLLAIINWLTGTGTIDASRPSYKKGAYIEQQEKAKAQREANSG